ncbi:protein ACCELERATED CELL DEATH 6-like [Silene latifolia]|uniref:protein ACCELERATED CELL DEATH 6-like n=1 Tax=Silene latifolia TaxID=37657 RepID=UPI003D7805A4
MDEQLYLAATEGKEDYLTEFEGSPSPATGNRNGIPDERYFLTQTPEGDNLLHLAASRDRLPFIVKALDKIPAVVLLICWGNNLGENPLHVAARLGQLDTVQVLVNQYKSYLHDIKERKERSTLLTHLATEKGNDSPEPWKARDSNGNTPLHEALKHGYEDVAKYLLEVEPELANYDNNANEGVLYLAAAYGHENVLETILMSTMAYSLSAPVGLTPLHVAVDTCTEGATKLLLEKHPELAKRVDKRKRTALYYAAQTNKQGHVEAILKAEKSCAYIRDEAGLTPLLRAASLGQPDALRTILLHCPESVAICDSKGKTALHLIEFRSYQEGIELLRNPAMKKLINIPDTEGNTPLHVAGKNSDHILAKVILDTDNTGATVRNKEGFTPWDIIKLQPELTEQMVEIGYQLLIQPSDEQKQPEVIQQMALHRPDDVNERLRRNFASLGLMAVILAAISFAAGFTSVDGFNRSTGLTRHIVFKVAVISNTAAMSGYTIVFFSTLWAMMIARRDDEPMFLLSFCIHVLQLAFVGTLIAFVSGLYALTSTRSLWLAIVVVCLPSSALILTISKSFVFRLARFFYRTRLY